MANIYNSYEPSVKYYPQTGRTKKSLVTGACFSALPQKVWDRVYFKCQIDPSLTIEKVTIYLEFLKKILNSKLFGYKFVENKKMKTGDFRDKDIQGNYVLFVLKSKSLQTRARELLYLSAFRYINEFPEITGALLDYLAANPGDKLDDSFLAFEKFHSSIKCEKYCGLSIHGLLAPGQAGTTLDKFRENLLNDSISSVQSHFI